MPAKHLDADADRTRGVCVCFGLRCLLAVERGGASTANNGIALIRVLISAGSSRTMSSSAALFNDGGQIYATPTVGQVGRDETGADPIQPVW